MGKRLAAGAAVLCLLFLCACAGGKALKAEDLDFTFSCEADISCKGGNFTCSFRRGGARSASVEILSGGAAGLAWYWGGDGFTQTYAGLAEKKSAVPLPESSFASVLVRALNSAERPGALTSSGRNEFTGRAEGMAFSLTADPQTGLPQTLAVPSWGLEAKFHDFDEKTPATQALETYAPD
ncbi:MAG TPA: hypothetical protein DEB16_01790 [Ruminococcaceae bacterium]|jgi:hypothetical protein|nr:hypothetical protein [Oscillospiraceae bacterium]HBQ45629.1 hypothetical protein [Oscillospiraceae bacterium]HBT90562.1 hypothetical protein [Oscillospiraceae bacterium]